MIFIIRPKVMLRLAVCYSDHRPPKFIVVIQGHGMSSSWTNTLGKFIEIVFFFSLKGLPKC